MTVLILSWIEHPVIKPNWFGDKTCEAIGLSLEARTFVNSLRSEFERAIGRQLLKLVLGPFFYNVIKTDSFAPGG